MCARMHVEAKGLRYHFSDTVYLFPEIKTSYWTGTHRVYAAWPVNLGDEPICLPSAEISHQVQHTLSLDISLGGNSDTCAYTSQTIPQALATCTTETIYINLFLLTIFIYR